MVTVVLRTTEVGSPISLSLTEQHPVSLCHCRA